MQRPTLYIALLILFFLTAPSIATSDEGAPSDATRNRAAWMAEGTYGVMVHYLIRPKGDTPEEKTADLNRVVDQFDLDGFIRQFEETGADWLIFTLGQTTGYLCSPSEMLDAASPGHTSRRDLLLEIATRLHAIDKRLIVYFPCEQDGSLPLREPLRADAPGYFDRYCEFLRQYSVKLGDLHDGWWFDACTPHPDEYWEQWLAAVRAGNPNAAVAFSGAEFCTGESVNPICKLSDYHAGEIHLLEDGKIRRDFLWPPENVVLSPDRKLRTPDRQPQFYLPDGPTIDGIQWHGLLPIDLTFNPAIPDQFCHYSDRELFKFVRSIKSVGGALTINVPIDVENGHIPDDSHAQLVRLRKAEFSE